VYPKLWKMLRACSALPPFMQYVTSALSLAGFAKPYLVRNSSLVSASALLSSGTANTKTHCSVIVIKSNNTVLPMTAQNPSSVVVHINMKLMESIVTYEAMNWL
jgi:hypothetical protein